MSSAGAWARLERDGEVGEAGRGRGGARGLELLEKAVEGVLGGDELGEGEADQVPGHGGREEGKITTRQAVEKFKRRRVERGNSGQFVGILSKQSCRGLMLHVISKK